MKGKVIKYNKKNIDTDLIIPARHLVSSDPDHLAEHCFEDLDPEFNQKKTQLGISIVVAESNFGSGSSREQAPLALKAAGIKCVIAPSFARIFFRNAINIGLPVLESVEIWDKVHDGDIVSVNLRNGQIINKSNDQTYNSQGLPDFIIELIEKGGLLNKIKEQAI